MLNNCILSARYEMVADVLTQTTSRDPDTGQQTRGWAVDRTITCQARGILSDGIRVVGSAERFDGINYNNVDWVKLKTGERLSKRDRVTNIRYPGGDPIWANDDGSPIEFELQGAQPTPAPFGGEIEYDVLLERVQH